jgi:hypothetical protein
MQEHPTPIKLRRLTTRYNEVQDRVQIAGEGAHKEVVVLWLTRRLLTRVVDPLVNWLQPAQGPEQALSHSFAQDAARFSLTPQSPVTVNSGVCEVLVEAVDFRFAPIAVQMIFRGGSLPHGACWVMHPLALRQWLSILHQQFVVAQWPLSIWPNWIEGATAAASVGSDGELQLH